MTYSNHHPIRLVAGRLALDFLNTANWSKDQTVAQDWIETHDDLTLWAHAAGLPDAGIPDSISELKELRLKLRQAFQHDAGSSDFDIIEQIHFSQVNAKTLIDRLRRQPILNLITISALSILSDPREMMRIKMCPGHNCGGMFLDETKNARRKWCAMDLCGNRAKASRNYAKRIKS